MGYRVKGTLKLPDGTPGTNCEIEFTSRKNFTPMLTGMGVSIRTDSTGAYDVTLEYGAYAVILRTGNTYPSAIGQLTVGPDTAVGQDLPTLLEQSGWQPATPEYIKQITEWLERAESAAVSAEASAVKASTDGAAQAALAKSQADRAKSEADRASQISGLDTVADAIAMAALPLPDVWAPLSDSLRMITGYGREVKVGDDVVARMVNFSRSTTATYRGKDGLLKTAAVNEPRFEREGILIEGLSTNTLQSHAVPNATYQVTKTEDVTAPDGLSLASTFTTTQAVNYLRFGSIVIGANVATITGSIWIKAVSGSGSVTLTVDDRNIKTITPTSEWVRYSTTRSVESTSTNIVDVRFVAGHNNLKIAVWGAQREAGPIATSLIPTSGAAATRAADVCSIPANDNWTNGDFVIAANLSYTKGLAENPILFVSGKDTPTAGFINTFLRDTNAPPDNRLAWYGAATSFLATSGALSTAVFRNRSGMRDIVYGGEILSMGAGVQNTAVPAIRIYLGNYGPTQFLNGHIRNLRIWHRALTDEQIKAIA